MAVLKLLLDIFHKQTGLKGPAFDGLRDGCKNNAGILHNHFKDFRKQNTGEPNIKYK